MNWLATGLPGLFDGRLHSGSKLLCRAAADVMEKHDGRACAHHMLMDRDDVNAVRTECLQHGLDFGIEHGDVARHDRIGVTAVKRRPGVQPHTGVDGCSHLHKLDIGSSDGDLVDAAVCLARRTDDVRQLSRIERTIKSSARGGRRDSRGSASAGG